MANPEHESVLRRAVANGDSSVNMSGFDLSGLRFSSVRLEGINLSAADLRGADLSGGYFRGCNLHRARLSKARFSLGDFRDAELSDTDFTAANLQAAVMTGANLQNANLMRTNLVRARLDGANLTGANLDRTDLRGVQGLTEAQLASTIKGDKAILDERLLAAFHRSGDATIARHGRQTKKVATPNRVDLTFSAEKPTFGDLFLMCGSQHPDFPPTGGFDFGKLTDLGIEQVDDYFAICADGDPVVWIYPLVQEEVVDHHPGPFDGIRIELENRSKKRLWTRCVARFEAALGLRKKE